LAVLATELLTGAGRKDPVIAVEILDHTSIAGGYRVHGGLVFHIEPFLRFIGLPKASLSAGFGRPHQAAREE
jgi:hypothetical protein